MGTIIIVDDNKGVLTVVQLLLKNHSSETVTLFSPVSLSSVLREENPEVVLLGMNFTSSINNGNKSLLWLHEIKHQCPNLLVVLFTAYADIDLAVRGIKEGATNFIVKPWGNQRLIETLLNATSQIKEGRKKNREKENPSIAAIYWGKSSAMQQLRMLVEKVTTTNTNVLVTGENGTGKEMLTREIHALPSRYKETVVSVGIGAITRSLFENELFGHVKGSFTGVHADRMDKFEAANRSSLFLDEIGNLPYHLQAKLLITIQQRSVIRVGSNESVPIGIRLIYATNWNLQGMTNRGEFREDLLYRINTIHVEIPPLHNRREDIVSLTERFITRFCRQYDRTPISSIASACGKLAAHSWYGNIRELEHAIGKTVTICDGSSVPAEIFQLIQKTEIQQTEVSTLEKMEKTIIRKALDKCGGSLSAVVSQLGITRQTLYNKMKRSGL